MDANANEYDDVCTIKILICREFNGIRDVQYKFVVCSIYFKP